MSETKSSDLPVMIASLLLFLGSLMLILEYTKPVINWEVVLTTLYTIIALLLVSKRLYLPKLTRLYELKPYEKVSPALFLVSSILLYDIGYKYNAGLLFQSILISVVTSAIIGLILGISLLIVSELYIRIHGGR